MSKPSPKCYHTSCLCFQETSSFLTNSNHEFFIKTLAVTWNSLSNRHMKFPCNSADWNLVKSWAELVETTSKVILSISTEFHGDCFKCKRVIMVNPWVELGQNNSTLVTHIFSVFQRDLEGTPRVLIKNSWVDLV